MKPISLLFIISILFNLSCAEKLTEPDNISTVKVDHVQKIADMNQTFGWDVLREEIKNKPDENILISPWSIQTAITMALNGAGNNTLAEMLLMLHCDNCNVSDINNKHNELTTLLTHQSGHPQINIANGYFYDGDRINVKSEFKSLLEQYYDCVFREENFDNEQTSLDHINGWVKEQTKGKIDVILDQISAEDIAFLINALHFKADWSQGFNTDLTQKRIFYKKDGSHIDTDFISNIRTVPSYSDVDYQIADIPFRDSTYSLSIITTSPNSTKDILNFSESEYDLIKEKLTLNFSHLSLPKLKMAYKNEMNKTLMDLGMHDAFNEGKADFKAMGTGAGDISIGTVHHKAVLEIDEKGAEGAAVTSIGFTITGLPQILNLTFNKPSIIILRHIETGALLFLGYIADPTF